MFEPSKFTRNVNMRQAASTRNFNVGPGSGGGGGTGAGNAFIGNGAGSNVSSGSNNVIIGSCPGIPALHNSVLIGDGTGRVVASWDADGTQITAINAADRAPDPTVNGTMATSFNPTGSSLRYRVRDALGGLRTIEVSAAPPPVEVAVRPMDVTQTSGDVTIERSEASSAGALTVPLTYLMFGGGGPLAVTGRFDVAAHGVPSWAGGAVFDLELCVRAEGAQGTVEIDLQTQDGTVYGGTFSLAGAAPAGATVRVAFQAPAAVIRRCADGNPRPILPLGAGNASAQCATVTLRRAAGSAAPPLHILGLLWRITMDPAAAAFAPPVLSAIPTVRGSTAAADLRVPLAAYQTTANTGPLAWKLSGASVPAGITVDRYSGVLCVTKGTSVVRPATANAAEGLFVSVADIFGATAERPLTFNV